jgi:DNA-binding CsgD family transcriptional regulator
VRAGERVQQLRERQRRLASGAPVTGDDVVAAKAHAAAAREHLMVSLGHVRTAMQRVLTFIRAKRAGAGDGSRGRAPVRARLPMVWVRGDVLPELTPREREVAVLVSEGLPNKDIARALVISRRTAEGHVENILSKLGLTSRAQIAAWVTRSQHFREGRSDRGPRSVRRGPAEPRRHRGGGAVPATAGDDTGKEPPR